MTLLRWIAFVALLGSAGPRLGSAQQPEDVSAGGEVLRVTGSVATSLTLTAADLAGMPRAAVSTTRNGLETHYEGVWMHEILRRAGVPLGEELRGPALATYVLARAEDGYRVVYSLGELDPAFHDNRVLLADTANGRALSGEEGSFRIVAPLDARGARSVRMLTELEVVRLPE
jgi:DMSO/TMAO reductase YedYZ molybdopterin-dependent catalytic subunit